MQTAVRRTIVALAILLAAGLPRHFFAQGLASQTARPAPASSRRVTIDVVVDAKGSKPPSTVPGLQREDFTVLDNKTPRTFDSFRAVSAGQEPVRVILLIDAVNLGIERLAYERNQISAFLRANGGHMAHPTTIAILTDQGVQLQNGFSTDGNQMSDFLQKQGIGIRIIGRSTGIWGAEERSEISLSALHTLGTHEAGQPGRTVILWISPGWPLLSGSGIELSAKEQKGVFNNIVALSAQLREERVTLYAIDPLGSSENVAETFRYESYLKGIGRSSDVDFGDLSLQVLAAQSGGLVLNSNDTAAVLQRCVADLGNYYEISFEAPPAETRDTYHHIEIKLDKPGMIARTRDGYYAQP